MALAVLLQFIGFSRVKHVKTAQKDAFFTSNIDAASQAKMTCKPPIHCRKAFLSIDFERRSKHIEARD
jgi:hypothetical protein